jgi:transposase InsO family protein
VLLTAKSEASSAIKRIQATAEKECSRKLQVLRTDNGGEFTVIEFAAYCADEGITRHFSAPYTPQQNGVVERRNQTVVAMARALLKQQRMPTEFWGGGRGHRGLPTEPTPDEESHRSHTL